MVQLVRRYVYGLVKAELHYEAAHTPDKEHRAGQPYVVERINL